MSILQNPNVEFDYAGFFCTEKDWIHPLRTESTYEILLVTKGEVFLREGEREYALSRGQALLLSPHVPHEGTRVSRDVGFYWVHFRLLGGALPFEQRFFEQFENPALFKELLHYNNLPLVPHDLVSAVLLHILADMDRLSRQQSLFSNSLAERIYEWLRINADASLSVEAAASVFGYSTDHFSKICKKHFGAGAGVLINRFLLARAKELLCNTDRYVKEIAAELHFPNDKAFIGFFKYHEGCFPSEFRNRFGKLHMNNR